MVLGRLTKKAKLVIATLSRSSKGNTAKVGKILSAIVQTSGMGNSIVSDLTKLNLDTNKSIDINSLVEIAYGHSIKLKHAYVGTEHLLLALLQIFSPKDFEKANISLLNRMSFPHGVGNSLESRKSPILDAFGINLNQKIAFENKEIPVDRTELMEVIGVLLQRSNSNALIVGEPGVGKRTLVSLLAHKINNLEIPPSLIGYQVIEFDFMAFMASIASKETLEIGLSALVDELSIIDKTILYIKNFQNMFISTANGIAIPYAFSMLKAQLIDTPVKMVSTMNESLYEKVTSEHDTLLEDFSIVNIGEPDENTLLHILSAKAYELEKFHNIKITKTTLKHIKNNAAKFLDDSFFPYKAIELLEQAATSLVVKNRHIPDKYKELNGQKEFMLNEIQKALADSNFEKVTFIRKELSRIENRLYKLEEKLSSNSTKLALSQDDVLAATSILSSKSPIKSDTTFKVDNLSSELKKMIIGQDKAIEIVSKVLIRAKLGLKSGNKPLGSFLFLGPTGVGKTELAKAISKISFSNNIVRLDMSEYSEKHNIARMIGSPPGYVGYGESGELTNKIENYPNSVVLFDEIEKAHPDVLNILLQILDEATLTDGKGKSYDFSKAVVILTSNIGSELLNQTQIGLTKEETPEDKTELKLKINLKKILKPELLNRFDEIVVFRKLSRHDNKKILEMLLAEYTKILKKRKIYISIPNNVKEHLLSSGYSEEYGARAIRRTIESLLIDKIADYLVSNPVDTIHNLKISLSEKPENKKEILVSKEA